MTIEKNAGTDIDNIDTIPRGNSPSVPANLLLSVPANLFSDRSLSVFEVLVEHLREKEKLSNNQIAVITNRDNKTIWTVYNRAQKKRKLTKKPELTNCNTNIPISSLLDRKFAVLESLVIHMKERNQLTYKQIAELTARNERTIWTVYNRATKKRAK